MRGIQLVSAAAAALVIAEACSAPVANVITDAGDAMRDAAVALDDGGLDTVAEVVRDAGSAVHDAGVAMRGDARVEADDGSVDGSRLKIRRRRYTAADGAVLLGPPTLFDAARGEPCTPGMARDGRLRCRPAWTPVASGWYADAGCSTLAALISSCADDAPRYAATSDGRCDPVTLHPIDSTALAVAYVRSGAACVATTPPAGYEVHAVGEAIDDSAFVEITGDGWD